MKGHDGWFSPIRLLAIVDPLLSSIIGKKTPFEGIHQITEFWVCAKKRDREKKGDYIRVCKEKRKGLRSSSIYLHQSF